ncbi:SCO2524 family protein [Paractinoplanes toevensis]|uniref:Uncharacterized protein n=1 Tax=Paractinoplanes toevensis TaxID=571911 RepID=A0A919W775_9ACTN|nr:SCO2524 family protein [Actinoplanes toevensis]GIM88461.1 hypothetical protein Ato02nite_002540 [Actinoplanes toevensis]
MLQIEPRQEILGIWGRVARISYRDDMWVPGGRARSNSISDAEQLLCILGPATRLRDFRVDDPDEVGGDAEAALSSLGTVIEVPQRLLEALTDYLDRYTGADGTPLFAGGSAFGADSTTATPEQQSQDVVDSFAVSVVLTLAIIDFARGFRRKVRRPEVKKKVDELAEKASTRLTAALIGLLRSFSVNVFRIDDREGAQLLKTLTRDGHSTDRAAQSLHTAVDGIRARLRDDVVGKPGMVPIADLEDNGYLFECGWSWGLVEQAPKVETSVAVGVQRDGVAENKPYLYFTTVAMEAIQELTAKRTQPGGLLTEEQNRLARHLEIRLELTGAYWATVATFGPGRWPLENAPWQTTDGLHTDYYTLLVTALLLHHIAPRPATADLHRIAEVLDDLAERSRISLWAPPDDPATVVHHPGIAFPLVGSEKLGGPRLSWIFADMAPQLLKSTLNLIGLFDHTGDERAKLLELADEIWNHLDHRRERDAAWTGLWDQPIGALPDVPVRHDEVSWYYTKRVVDCLVTAVQVIEGKPPESELVDRLAADLLQMANHRYSRELLRGSPRTGNDMGRIRAGLERARQTHTTAPDIALGYLFEALRELDRVAAAWQNDAG